MKYHFTSIPAVGGEAAQAELNRFLAAHRVVHVEHTLVPDGSASFWAVCVRYTEGASSPAAPAAAGRKQVDYKEILSEAQFKVYSRLRDVRRTLADREGTPLYSVFTNEQLAAIAEKPIRTLDELGALPGVGPGRLEKYGAAILAAVEPADASS